jgi:hypothetical protein
MMMKMMDSSHKEIVPENKPERAMETTADQEMEAHPKKEKPA